ncbi:MAG: alpha/beta hydrolase [Gammaproteobacteria bacterium]|nr:alpha/beta hydrolase [Gammaproteobacteria bacterium]
MKIYFSHGKESGPRGFKIKRLAVSAERHGCAVESIDYTDTMDPDLRVGRLLAALENETDSYVLVGSSMGGYVSLVASETAAAKAVFLMAPALYMPGLGQQEYASKSPHIEIVHGWSDEVIPVENSIRYSKAANCTLHLISGDHALNAEIDVLEGLFDAFLAKTLG